MGREVKAGIVVDVLDKASPKLGALAKKIAADWKIAIPAALAGGAVAIAAGIANAVSSIAQMGAELGSQAGQLNMGVDNYLALRDAAAGVGIQHEQAFDALRQFNSILGRAALGSGESAKMYDALGVSIYDVNGQLKDATSVLLESADKLAAMEDNAAKSAITFKLFGETGARFQLLLSQGSAAIKEQIQDFKELRGGMGVSIARSIDYEYAQLRLNTALEGTKTAVFSGFMPGMTAVLNILADLQKAMRGTVNDSASGIAKTLAVVVRLFGLAILGIKRQWIELKIWFAKFVHNAFVFPLESVRDAFASMAKKGGPAALVGKIMQKNLESAIAAIQKPGTLEGLSASLGEASKAFVEFDRASRKALAMIGVIKANTSGAEETKTGDGSGSAKAKDFWTRHLQNYLNAVNKNFRSANEREAAQLERMVMDSERLYDTALATTEAFSAFGRTIYSAFESGISQGKKFHAILGDILKSLAATALQNLVGGIFGAIGGALAGSLLGPAGAGIGASAGFGVGIGGSGVAGVLGLGLTSNQGRSGTTIIIKNETPLDRTRSDQMVRDSFAPALMRTARDGGNFNY